MTKTFFKEYTKELAEKLFAAISTVKAVEIKGEGTFKVIASTADFDRDGEKILVEGWDFKNYLQNPIILFGHKYNDLNAIIGAATDIQTNKSEVIISGVFAATDAGQYARKLYDDGILRTVSVGFIPRKRDANIITEAELLEVSFVPVPANPHALSLSKEFAEKFLTKSDESEDAEKVADDEVPADEPEKVADDQTIIDDVKVDEKPEDADAGNGEGVDGEKSLTADVDEKSGRTLSAKSKTLIKKAIDALDNASASLAELLAYAESDSSDDGKADDLAEIKLLQGVDKIVEELIKNRKKNL